MLGSVRISATQGFMLAIASITVTGHLLFIPVIINHAGRDSWLSVLIAMVPAVLIGFVISSLAKLYPGRTIIEYTQEITGKWLGKFISCLFIFYFFHDTSLAIRGFGEFFTSAITPRTPIMVYFVAITILAVYAVRNGLEVMARANQIFLVCMIPVGLTATVLTQKDKVYKNFLPILEYGPQPALMGMFTLVSLYSTFVILGMIFPFFAHQEKIRKGSMITMLILIVMFLGPVTGPIAVFGLERSIGLSFPTFQLLRDIQVGDLQRLDLIGIVLWSLGSFAKISIFLFGTTVGLAQLFRLEDFRALAAPTGALLVIVSLLNSENYIEMHRFFRDTFPYYSVFIGGFIPLVLFIIAIIRRLFEKRRENV